ncbi:molybdopterin-guanine dinucleotide biosynthesis protein MobA [Acidovorax sp. SRB_14]|uniref:nucleotidyltransferase family protein n=1 Tax=Acidovorax sp. SRB_14 TaxID=1962699 RepID=UPI0015671F22|nr:NTP transferase domain-containing protein [Acidovorax sp. SRB_14]NMM79439.1 molybdopterin-guanine dinucleotide biosynthesis protein MobA [Acidovorax sp. SRB_14]
MPQTALPSIATSSISTEAALPHVLVLASGKGARFRASGGGTPKLQALLEGKPVLQHTLDAVRASGLPWRLEDAGHPGMGDSIAAAVRATASAAGWLVLPGDLPLIQPGSLRAVAAALLGCAVAVPVVAGQRGHPVGFAAQCLPDLLALHGDTGAAAVVRKFAAQGTLREVLLEDGGAVTDIDTLDDLERAAQMLRAKRSAAAP